MASRHHWRECRPLQTSVQQQILPLREMDTKRGDMFMSTKKLTSIMSRSLTRQAA